MAFTETETTTHLETLERVFWSRRRPPPDLRDEVREGQRITGQSIELFLIRPSFSNPEVKVEEPIAKLKYLRKSDEWQIFWQRGNGKWTRYDETPKLTTLEHALRIVDEDPHYCFFG